MGGETERPGSTTASAPASPLALAEQSATVQTAWWLAVIGTVSSEAATGRVSQADMATATMGRQSISAAESATSMEIEALALALALAVALEECE